MAAEKNELELLACVVHAVLAVLHVLGFVFNVRRKNVADSVVHALAATYDTASAIKHGKAVTSGS